MLTNIENASGRDLFYLYERQREIDRYIESFRRRVYTRENYD